MRPPVVKWMPTFVPSIFSSTINDGAAINASESFWPRWLSSSVPFEPNKCGVRGYLMKSSRVAPIFHELTSWKAPFEFKSHTFLFLQTQVVLVERSVCDLNSKGAFQLVSS